MCVWGETAILRRETKNEPERVEKSNLQETTRSFKKLRTGDQVYLTLKKVRVGICKPQT